MLHHEHQSYISHVCHSLVENGNIVAVIFWCD